MIGAGLVVVARSVFHLVVSLVLSVVLRVACSVIDFCLHALLQLLAEATELCAGSACACCRHHQCNDCDREDVVGNLHNSMVFDE